MVTTAQDAHADYRGGWKHVGMGDKTNLVTAGPKPTIEAGNKFTELTEPLDDVEFPIPNPVGESRVKHHMPRITRGNQKARAAGKCDADRMGNSEFGILIKAHSKQNDCGERCCAEITSPLHEETIIDVPIIKHNDKDDIEFDGKHEFDPYNTNMATVMMANIKKRDLEVWPVLKELSTIDKPAHDDERGEWCPQCKSLHDMGPSAMCGRQWDVRQRHTRWSIFT